MRNTDKHDEKILEIDVPPNVLPDDENESFATKIVEQSVAKKETESLEQKAKYADRMERHIYKRHGLHLLIGCLIAYGLVVVFDTFVPLLKVTTSEFSSGFVELLKFVVSTLIGFVFSESLKNDKEK